MIYFISHKDIQNSALELTLLSELNKCTDFLYLTATANLKSLRLSSNNLSDMLISNDETANIFTATEYINYISKQVYSKKRSCRLPIKSLFYLRL